MAITADLLVTPPPNAAAAASALRQPQPVIAPANERENAGHQRRESGKNGNAPLNFRAVLSAATLEGLGRSDAAQAWTPSEGPLREAPQRASRFPVAEPLEISGAEARDLFDRAIAQNTRKSNAPEFVAATARYTSSYFAGSSFYAKPGETLELTV